MKNIAILGSTGSIGQQTLQVVSQHPDKFKVVAVSARQNIDLLIEQAKKFKPEYVAITSDTVDTFRIKHELDALGIELLTGFDSLNIIASLPQVDTVVTAIVGFSGLLPTISAILAGKNIALANKETLVVAGELVMKLAAERNVKILPVDSEHSAIFQSIVGEQHKFIEKIYLTASGGPFRGMKPHQLATITKQQALNHPNWKMGSKITIDSATLMNKGLEAIEARWLFNLKPGQIDIVIHPQSIIHSMVQFIDGSIKAQMGLPDMRLPIQYALTYPERLENDFPRFDFFKHSQLTFEKPDIETFKALKLALQAMNRGGNMPCVLNAANEVAVQAFLNSQIGFMDIANIVEQTLNAVEFITYPSLDDYLECDRTARQFAQKFIKNTKR